MRGTVTNVEGIYSYKDNLMISHAVRTGNTIHISGQVALDPDGNVVGKGDVETQAEYIWRNVEKVLEASGSGLEEIAKVFQFVVGTENFAGMGAVRRRIFPQEPFPAFTSIIVSGLIDPDLLLEVDVIATVKY
ncbi:MAG: RidA family protein [Dehalococcoidia bacterium]